MKRPLLAPNVPIDLSNCDLEPIHIPSSIQPHGMLLAARSSDLRVVYVSANSESFLGFAPSYVLERTLTEILGSDAVESIEHSLGQELYVPKDIRTFTFPLYGEQRFDVTAHRTQGLLCLELELSQAERRWDLVSSRLEGAMHTLSMAKTLPDLCAATVSVLRGVTGYDRVMAYKFDSDGHGEVVAEDKVPEIEPFLGLHYPATDIPAQARKLFLHQRFRTIVDVNYVPVPLLASRSLRQDAPLDMTYCGLRSVSPIHIEYLQNMGVRASLSISLIVGGELWGMILCHHRTPGHLAPETRALCDLLGQLVSLFLGAIRQSDEAAEERQKRILLEELTNTLASGPELEQSLVSSGDALLALTCADGAIVKVSGRLSLIGKTPGAAEASSLLTAFETLIQGEITASHEIGAILPAFSHLAALASGGLMISPGGEGNGILWLRGQMAEAVRWAGKPDASKHVFEGTLRLSPRKSFAVWEQIQHGRSIPWRAVEIEAALSLERIIARALLVQLTQDLAESHEKARKQLQAVIDGATQVAIIAANTDGVITLFNSGASKMLGYTPEEVVGKHTPTLFHVDSEVAARELELTAETGRTVHGYGVLTEKAGKGQYEEREWTYVRKDDSELVVSLVVTGFGGAGGTSAGFLGVATDLTRRKKAEDHLRTTVRRLGLAMDALNAGVWDWNVLTGDVEWDARLCEIFGIPATTKIDYQLWSGFVEPEDLPAAEAALQGLIASKSHSSFEFRIQVPDGSTRYIQAAAGAILDDAGQVVRLIGINIDATDRKFNEDLERQVGKRTAQLEAVNKELEEFAYVASHDLKAPLRVIDNASKWLEEDLAEHLTADTRETMKLLRSRVERMEKLLDDLLEYARIGRTPGGPPGEVVSGDVLVSDVLGLLPTGYFNFAISPRFSTIQLIRMPLQQILSNLIGNAIKHHDRHDGRIEVTVTDDGEFYEFAVHDDGPGIPVQFHDQIFKMFQTLRPRDQVEGSGMGLAMARKTVELYGGVLRVESAAGQGCTFRFTWPIQERTGNGWSSEFLDRESANTGENTAC